jgi:hypothetical protein
MDKEKQRIKIAEACGASIHKDIAGFWNYTHPEKADKRVDKHHSVSEAWKLCAPDYLNDRNAMASAKDSIPLLARIGYCKILTEVCRREQRHIEGAACITIAYAKAEHEAEAFLRVMGLWEGEQFTFDESARKPVAWMRKWYFDQETPTKVKNEKGRWVWPAKYKFVPVSANKCLPDDIPLFT